MVIYYLLIECVLITDVSWTSKPERIFFGGFQFEGKAIV